MKDYQRILIMKPSSLGDIVHTLPIFHVLREQYPHASISWFVKRQWAELLECVEGLNRIIPVDSGLSAWLSQVPPLREAKFDLVLDLQGLFRSGSMSWLTGCRTRLGFSNAREGSPWFYSHLVDVPKADMHAVDRYLLFGKALEISQKGSIKFGLQVTTDDQDELRNLFKAVGQQEMVPPLEKLIGLNPSARWMTKRWPCESYAAVADYLQEEGLGRVLLLGGREDQRLAQEIQGQMKTSLVDLTGKTRLRVLPALFKQLDVLITNDSGPMHIAAAVGTPVVALFGATSATRTGPYGEGHSVLSHNVPCRPCFSRTCRHSAPLACLTEVSPTQVVETVRPLLTLPTNRS